MPTFTRTLARTLTLTRARILAWSFPATHADPSTDPYADPYKGPLRGPRVRTPYAETLLETPTPSCARLAGGAYWGADPGGGGPPGADAQETARNCPKLLQTARGSSQ
eukprot:2799732-Alexandrium_andersonii.AAC.1